MLDSRSALTLAEVADALAVPVTRVHQYLRDGQLVATRDVGGSLRVPDELLSNGAIVKGLPGVITLLRDAHYSDDEILAWLQRADDTLPGRPIDALRADRGREVKRRAQAAGY